MPIPKANELASLERVRWADYRDKLQQLITDAVYAQFKQYDNGGWEENQVTTRIATALVDSGRALLDDKEKLVWVNWRAQRFRGRAEYQRGDLGLAVHFHFQSNQRLTGYAHLEAKLFRYRPQRRGGRPIDLRRGTFPELEPAQLLTHLEHTHAHYVLLYDVCPHAKQHSAGPIRAEPHAETLISNHVISLAINNRRIYRNTEPFSGLIVNRLLHGYGLDYRKPPEHVVSMWESSLPTGVILHGDVVVGDEMDWPEPDETVASGSGGGSAIGLEDALVNAGFDEFINTTVNEGAVSVSRAD